ncbi:MAG: hypothetical protein RQ866_01120 [Bacteroidales bacterium]|nr:hypothetical protein [Bacteroidales bacterium]
MKNLSLILLLLFIPALFLSAQTIEVEEGSFTINDKNSNVFNVIIYHQSERNVERAFTRLMKSYDAKVSSRNNIFADNAEIIPISVNTLDVYAFIKKVGEGIKLTVGFDMGDIFLSSATDEKAAGAAKKILFDFANDLTKQGIEEKKRQEEKEQKRLEKRLKQLEKENKRLIKSIERYKKQIADAEEDIVQNEKQQQETTEAIEKQKGVVKRLSEAIKKLR